MLFSEPPPAPPSHCSTEYKHYFKFKYILSDCLHNSVRTFIYRVSILFTLKIINCNFCKKVTYRFLPLEQLRKLSELKTFQDRKPRTLRVSFFKGTVFVILSDPSFSAEYVRFTTTFNLSIIMVDNVVLLDKKVLNSDASYFVFLQQKCKVKRT